MGKIIMYEQDIVNALCIYFAEKKNVAPNDVEIELMYDDDNGFSAESHALGKLEILTTFNMIEAIRYWLETEKAVDPFAARIELVLDENEGIIALVK